MIRNRTLTEHFVLFQKNNIPPACDLVSPLGCGAAHVRPSAPPYVVYSGTLRSSLIPFLLVAFYALYVCSYSDSEPCLQAFGWSRRTHFLGVPMAKRHCPFSRWTFSEEDVDAFFFSFRLIFTQNVGRAFSARRSASYSNSRLTEGEIPTPFSSSAPSGTRGVCMQKVVCQGKVRLIFTTYILLFFFFFLLFSFFKLYFEVSRKRMCATRAAGIVRLV